MSATVNFDNSFEISPDFHSLKFFRHVPHSDTFLECRLTDVRGESFIFQIRCRSESSLVVVNAADVMNHGYVLAHMIRANRIDHNRGQEYARRGDFQILILLPSVSLRIRDQKSRPRQLCPRRRIDLQKLGGFYNPIPSGLVDLDPLTFSLSSRAEFRFAR